MNVNEHTALRGRITNVKQLKVVPIQRCLMGPPTCSAPKKKSNSTPGGTKSSLTHLNWKSLQNSKENSTIGRSTSSHRSRSSTETESRVVLALTEGRGEATGEVGIAAINIAQPFLIVCQITDSQSYINTLTKINILNPYEILVPLTFVETSTVGRLIKKLKEQFTNVKITAVSRKSFNQSMGLQYIKNVCLSSMDSIILILQHKYYALSAAAALLTYMETILFVMYAKESIKVEYQESEGFTIIDVATADRLELVASTRPEIKRRFSCLLDVLNHCHTKIGTRTLRATILQPPCSVSEIEARLDCVTELMERPDMLAEIQTILPNLSNIDQLMTLATVLPDKAQNCSERQINYILLLNIVFGQLEPLREIFENSRQPFFIELRDTLGNPALSELHKVVQSLIHTDAHIAKGQSGMLQQCFAIKSGINSLLDLVRKSYSERFDDLREYIKGLGERYSLGLSLNHNHKKGYHIVFNLNKHQKMTFKKKDLPDEFIQIDRLANSYTMKTEHLINLSNQVEDILLEILKMSNIMIYNLLIQIRLHIGIFFKLCEDIAKLDMLQSLARASSAIHYVRPKFGNYLEVLHARHPLLDFLCSVEPSANSFHASNEYNMNIITGPNGSGKSIFIRQIVLIQVMAQVGCYVPAQSAILRVSDRILTRIYLEDNMNCGASAFTLEMKEIQYFFTVLTKNTLIIIDELCRSTSLEEGSAMAMAICEALMGTPAFTFFTTHFKIITKLREMHFNVRTWQMETITEIVNEKIILQFNYNVIPGVIALEQYGIFLAKASWPAAVIDNAERILKLLSKSQQLPPRIQKSYEAARLKYDTEATFIRLKELKQLTRARINEQLLVYQSNLSKFGVFVELNRYSPNSTVDKRTVDNQESQGALTNIFQPPVQQKNIFDNIQDFPNTNRNNCIFQSSSAAQTREPFEISAVSSDNHDLDNDNQSIFRCSQGSKTEMNSYFHNIFEPEVILNTSKTFFNQQTKESIFHVPASQKSFTLQHPTESFSIPKQHFFNDLNRTTQPKKICIISNILVKEAHENSFTYEDVSYMASSRGSTKCNDSAYRRKANISRVPSVLPSTSGEYYSNSRKSCVASFKDDYVSSQNKSFLSNDSFIFNERSVTSEISLSRERTDNNYGTCRYIQNAENANSHNNEVEILNRTKLNKDSSQYTFNDNTSPLVTEQQFSVPLLRDVERTSTPLNIILPNNSNINTPNSYVPLKYSSNASSSVKWKFKNPTNKKFKYTNSTTSKSTRSDDAQLSKENATNNLHTLDRLSDIRPRQLNIAKSQNPIKPSVNYTVFDEYPSEIEDSVLSQLDIEAMIESDVSTCKVNAIQRLHTFEPLDDIQQEQFSYKNIIEKCPSATGANVNQTPLPVNRTKIEKNLISELNINKKKRHDQTTCREKDIYISQSLEQLSYPHPKTFSNASISEKSRRPVVDQTLLDGNEAEMEDYLLSQLNIDDISAAIICKGNTTNTFVQIKNKDKNDFQYNSTFSQSHTLKSLDDINAEWFSDESIIAKSPIKAKVNQTLSAKNQTEIEDYLLSQLNIEDEIDKQAIIRKGNSLMSVNNNDKYDLQHKSIISQHHTLEPLRDMAVTSMNVNQTEIEDDLLSQLNIEDELDKQAIIRKGNSVMRVKNNDKYDLQQKSIISQHHTLEPSRDMPLTSRNVNKTVLNENQTETEDALLSQLDIAEMIGSEAIISKRNITNSQEHSLEPLGDIHLELFSDESDIEKSPSPVKVKANQIILVENQTEFEEDAKEKTIEKEYTINNSQQTLEPISDIHSEPISDECIIENTINVTIKDSNDDSSKVCGKYLSEKPASQIELKRSLVTNSNQDGTPSIVKRRRLGYVGAVTKTTNNFNQEKSSDTPNSTSPLQGPSSKKGKTTKRKKWVPPFKTLNKKEIEREYYEQDKKMFESENSSEYLMKLTNRPTVRQLQQVQHIVSIHKTQDGVVVLPREEPKPRIKKRKFVPPLKKKAEEFDVSLFSDKNVEKFEKFMNTFKESSVINTRKNIAYEYNESPVVNKNETNKLYSEKSFEWISEDIQDLNTKLLQNTGAPLQTDTTNRGRMLSSQSQKSLDDIANKYLNSQYQENITEMPTSKFSSSFFSQSTVVFDF